MEIIIGRIVKPHGIKGDVVIKVFCQNPLQLGYYNPLFDKFHHPYTLKIHKKISHCTLIAHIQGCEDRNQAENLRSIDLMIDRSQLPILEDPHEFYINDLMGLIVIDYKTQNICGKVSYIHNFGAGNILEIIQEDGPKKSLGHIPFHKDAVLEVNLKNKHILIDRCFLI